MECHVQVSTWQQGGEGSWESYSKQRVRGFSLAEALLGMKSSVSSSFGTLLSSQQ